MTDTRDGVRFWLTVGVQLFLLALVVGGCTSALVAFGSHRPKDDTGSFDCGRYHGDAYNACVDDYAERFLPQ